METITQKGDNMSEVKIKEFKYDNGWAEVTWAQYTTTTKEVEVDGEVTTEGSVEEIVLHCESFGGHPEYIAMMEAKASEFGTSLDEYAELIEELKASYIAPTQAELDEAERVHKIAEAKAYLSATDFKMTVDYFGGLVKEVQDELVAKRAEAREFVRANSGGN